MPPNCLATSGGQRRCRPAALRFPTDSVAAAQQPCDSQRRRFTVQQPCTPQRMLSTLPGGPSTPSGRRRHCRWLDLWCQHPRYRRCVSLLSRRTAPCQLRVKRRAVCSPQRLAMAINRRRVFPERPRAGKRTLRGNISPLCIQIKLIMARIDPHVFVLPCKMPLGNTLSEDLAAKGRYFRPKPPNHA